jgi:hypothetical protein
MLISKLRVTINHVADQPEIVAQERKRPLVLLPYWEVTGSTKRLPPIMLGLVREHSGVGKDG